MQTQTSPGNVINNIELIIMTLLQPIKRIIDYFEDPTIPFGNFVLTFFCAITLRNFFESFSHTPLFNLLNLSELQLLRELLQYTLFYVFLALLLILFLYVLTRIKIPLLCRVILPGFLLTCIVPVIDMLFSPTGGHHITYLFPTPAHSLVYFYLHFFGDYTGVSLGMKIEISLALLFVFLYVQVKKNNFLMSLCAALLTYSVIFFVGASPYVICYLLRLFSVNCVFSAQLMSHYFLFALIPSGAIFAYLTNQQMFLAVTKDLRWLRVMHYELMLLFGMMLALHKINLMLLPQLLFMMVAVLFFCLFSIITNNIADQRIDMISNPHRPLSAQTITLSSYITLAWVSLLLALLYASQVSAVALSAISCVTLLYFVYSMPPLRIKRIPVLSKAVIAAASLILILLGYNLVAGDWHGFPQSLIWIFLIGVTLSANFIDIKDYAGDKAENILTLPVLLGVNRAKKLIGVFFLLTALSFIFYSSHLWLLPLLLLIGILGYYFLTREVYKEYKVFLLYLISLIILIFSLWIKNTY